MYAMIIFSIFILVFPVKILRLKIGTRDLNVLLLFRPTKDPILNANEVQTSLEKKSAITVVQ